LAAGYFFIEAKPYDVSTRSEKPLQKMVKVNDLAYNYRDQND
jgi:hypothetical protein